MRPRRHRPFRFIAPLILLLAIAAIFFRFHLLEIAREMAEPLPSPTPGGQGTPAPVSAAEAMPTATPRPDLPKLEESDEWIRTLAAGLSSHPKLAAWMLNDRLVHRFVATVDNVAEGKSPDPHMRFLTPTTRFRVMEDRDHAFADPAVFDRNRAVVDVVTSLDAKGSAELYQAAKPLIDEEYRRLGYPDRKFDDTLTRAIDNLLRTPIPPRTPRFG